MQGWPQAAFTSPALASAATVGRLQPQFHVTPSTAMPSLVAAPGPGGRPSPCPGAAAMAAQAQMAGAQLLRPQVTPQPAAPQRVITTPVGAASSTAATSYQAASVSTPIQAVASSAVGGAPQPVFRPAPMQYSPSTTPIQIQAAAGTQPGQTTALAPGKASPYTFQGGFAVANNPSYGTGATAVPNTSYASPFVVSAAGGQRSYSLVAPVNAAGAANPAANATVASIQAGGPTNTAATSISRSAQIPQAMSISMPTQANVASATGAFPAGAVMVRAGVGTTSSVTAPPATAAVAAAHAQAAAAAGVPAPASGATPGAVAVGAPAPVSTATWPQPYKPGQAVGAHQLLGSIQAQPQAATMPRPPMQVGGVQQSYQLQAAGGRVFAVPPQQAQPQQWPPRFVQQPQQVLYR